jgi:hypothetical protein
VGTYSFQDVQCTVVGPGGAISLGSSQAVANEGITIEFVGDRNTMTVGAGQEVMHSLHAAKPATFTVRLLKTSTQNQLLAIMFDLQTSSSALWGTNVIVVSDLSRGDVATGWKCAFQKFPNNSYATEGNTLDWVFQAGSAFEILGSGKND